LEILKLSECLLVFKKVNACTSLKLIEGFIIKNITLELDWKGTKVREPVGSDELVDFGARTRVMTILPVQKSAEKTWIGALSCQRRKNTRIPSSLQLFREDKNSVITTRGEIFFITPAATAAATPPPDEGCF
jgi:hypothetical protein